MLVDISVNAIYDKKNSMVNGTVLVTLYRPHHTSTNTRGAMPLGWRRIYHRVAVGVTLNLISYELNSP